MEASQAGGAGGAAASSSDFVRKLYKMLENPSDGQVVRWGNEGDSFVVLENEKFTKHVLPKHFKHSNFASFVRQLNKYDFHKVRHNNEESGQSPYGPGSWEFKHPDFKENNKDALDNIRRKAPAPRKSNQTTEDPMIPTPQMDLVNAQLGATQQQLQQLQERYNELSVHHSMLLQELIGIQKTVVNQQHIMQNVMHFLTDIDAQRRRENRVMNPFAQSRAAQNGTADQTVTPMEDDLPASPLQHAAKLLSETNADVMLNPRNLEHMNELSMRMSGTLTTPPPDFIARSSNRHSGGDTAPTSAASSTSFRHADLDNLVYPVGQTNGIDPTYSEHVNNIPYPLPTKPPEPNDPRAVANTSRKKSNAVDPGWIRQPQILLVEDDPTCRRIGGKFLYAFNCSIDSALDGLEAVNKVTAGAKYDLILMDIIMPNLDGVSACHLIRQFDTTPIIAMTSNIRNDDISMYFQHGMNDVLPKPFTKEGLLHILNKHLGHLKKSAHNIDNMAPPQQVQPIQPVPQHTSRHSIKSEDSPGKSPATTAASNWSSPNNQIPGASPVSSNLADPEYMTSQAGYGMIGAGMGGLPGQFTTTTQQQQQQQQPHPHQHRRQISDISGGEEVAGSAKRQQMYGGMPQLHGRR